MAILLQQLLGQLEVMKFGNLVLSLNNFDMEVVKEVVKYLRFGTNQYLYYHTSLWNKVDLEVVVYNHALNVEYSFVAEEFEELKIFLIDPVMENYDNDREVVVIPRYSL